jgi:hypothetical protein
MKYETTNKTTAVERGGQVNHAALCKALKAPIDATLTLVTATHQIAITPDDSILVSFVQNVKPRARKAVEA